MGPALGAARLGQFATQPERSIEQIYPQPQVLQTHIPNASSRQNFDQRRALYTRAYPQLCPLFNKKI